MGAVLRLESFSLQEVTESLKEAGGERPPFDEVTTRLLLDELHSLGLIEIVGSRYRLANRQHARILYQAPDFQGRKLRAQSSLRTEQLRQRRVYCLPDEEREVLTWSEDSHVVLLGLPGSGHGRALDAFFDSTAARRTKGSSLIRLPLAGVEALDGLAPLFPAGVIAGPTQTPIDLAQALLGWHDKDPVTSKTLVLEDADTLAEHDFANLSELLSLLGEETRPEDRSLKVRIVLSGTAPLARAWCNGLFLTSQQASLRRLDLQDLRNWLRERNLVLGSEPRQRLFELTGGRLSFLEDFRAWLAERSSDPKELLGSPGDVTEYGQLIRTTRRSILHATLLGGLEADELAVLKRAMLHEDYHAEDSVGGEIYTDLFCVSFEELQADAVQAAVDVLLSLDLLSPLPGGEPGFKASAQDPLRALLAS
jgi:hypothetical protein